MTDQNPPTCAHCGQEKEINPYHPSLRLHPLSGRLTGLHSVSINLSYRITLEFLIKDQEILPVNVGDHDTVY